MLLFPLLALAVLDGLGGADDCGARRDGSDYAQDHDGVYVVYAEILLAFGCVWGEGNRIPEKGEVGIISWMLTYVIAACCQGGQTKSGAKKGSFLDLEAYVCGR